MKHSELAKLCKVMGIDKCLYEDLPRKGDIIDLILNAQRRRGLSHKKSSPYRNDCQGRECFYKSKTVSELRDILHSRNPHINIFIDDLKKNDLIEELLKLDYELYGPETLGSLRSSPHLRRPSRRPTSFQNLPFSAKRRSPMSYHDDSTLPENVRAVQNLLQKENPSLSVRKSRVPTRRSPSMSNIKSPNMSNS